MALFWEEMDQAGIDIGVVVGRNSPEAFLGKKIAASYVPNEHVAELQSSHSGRLVGIAGIDVSNRAHDAVREIRRSISELDLKGIFIEPGRALLTHPADERLRPVYEECAALDVPVVIMSGVLAGADINIVHPVHIDQIATLHPTLKIVLGHGAWPWVLPIVAVAFKHPNVFISPDAYMFFPGGTGYLEAANGLLMDKMLFGTAYPAAGTLPEMMAKASALALSDAARPKFMGLNAARLLGIDGRSQPARP